MKTAVLVSGGVDSALALHRLVDSGRTGITAYYLKIWLEDELSFLGTCPWEEDLGYARAVCDAVGVPLEVVPMQQQYYERVVSYTLDELRAGRTPSPDIFCNQRVKFGAFLEAVGADVDSVASGHYAQKERVEGGWLLKRAPDPVKDQTYFLSHLSQAQLARAEFPIGVLTKAQVRDEAARRGLANQNRPDSQGICFLGKIRYSDFVRHYLGESEGPIVEFETGRVLGRHQGAWFFTIGQRQGLGLGNGPWYVRDKSIAANTVWVSHREHRVDQHRFEVHTPNWILRAPDVQRLLVRIRHGPELTGATVQPDASGTRWSVRLDRGDPGIAPGQYAVFYDGEYCLGGGMIVVPRSGEDEWPAVRAESRDEQPVTAEPTS